MELDIDKLAKKAANEDVEVYSDEYINECLNESIVTRDKKVKDEKFIVSLCVDSEYQIMSLGNISGVIGGAKAKKTFFMSMLLSCFDNYKNKYGIIANRDDRKILCIDTEQSFMHTQKVLKRICRINGDLDCNVDMYALREYHDVELRIAIIKKLISTNKYSFVLIDGIVDLVNDYNSLSESRSIVSRIMSWSSKYNCHICNVLHTNKDKHNARGHIGTELINKSEIVIRITKQDDETSEVQCDASRNKAFKKFEFGIRDGLPIRYDNPIGDSTTDKAPF